MKSFNGKFTSGTSGYAAACSASACSIISLISDAIITASVFVVRVTELLTLVRSKLNNNTPKEMCLRT